jgi:hypothetical protein
MQFTLVWLPSLAVGLVGSTLIAWAASRFFSEARRSGEIELLLTTPLGAERIVRDQWSALNRLLRLPVLLLCSATLFPFILSIASRGLLGGFGSQWVFFSGPSLVLGLANTILGVMALCWLGMWFGLTARNQAVAIFRTVCIAKGIPYLITLLSNTVVWVLVSGFASSIGMSYTLLSWLPQVAVLFIYFWLIRWAKSRLLTSGLKSQDPRLKTLDARL